MKLLGRPRRAAHVRSTNKIKKAGALGRSICLAHTYMRLRSQLALPVQPPFSFCSRHNTKTTTSARQGTTVNGHPSSTEPPTRELHAFFYAFGRIPIYGDVLPQSIFLSGGGVLRLCSVLRVCLPTSSCFVPLPSLDQEALAKKDKEEGLLYCCNKYHNFNHLSTRQ